jgi:RNA polymerase sigma-70 factor (ECF subfamily)
MVAQILEVLAAETDLPLSSSAEDRVWISKTLAGEPQAFGHLINKYKDQLFDLACRVLKDRCQAEDILQDAFIQAYRHLNSFRFKSQFSTWIYTIVMNSVRNRLRRNKIVGWSSLDAPRPGQEDGYGLEIRHKELAIETMIERKMDIEAIQQIVASLPLSYQSIFTMHYIHNLPLQEIAERLRKPLGTIKVYLHRSRKLIYAGYQSRANLLESAARPSEMCLVP